MTPVRTRPIYMDHNATTPVHPEVVEAMLPYFSREFGNPSSTTHVYGRRAAEAVNEAREAIARLLGASSPDEVVFTAGATESDNLAIRGGARRLASRGDHIVTCAIEHEAVLETCASLREEGFETTVVPVEANGCVDPGRIRSAMTQRTILVSIMMANNEIGTVQPLAEIGAICHARGVVFHSDAVQAFGRIPVAVADLGVDLLSVTAHKMYGPKGIGALYIRRGVDVAPLSHGGGQERNLRSGTLNVPGIVGFGKAAEIAARDMEVESSRQRRLRERLWREIQRRVEGVSVNGSLERRLPNNLSVAFEGVESEAVLTAMRNVAALSAGSACASQDGKGSYVIRALGEPRSAEKRARSSIRFGLGRSNNDADVDHVVEGLASVVARLRSMAPPAVPVGRGVAEGEHTTS
ncbi:MAG: cysteine desulfurase family protein [Acidobacteriota bacterium]